MKLLIICIFLITFVSCSMFNTYQQSVEDCVINLVKNRMPSDLAYRYCHDIYYNVPQEYRGR